MQQTDRPPRISTLSHFVTPEKARHHAEILSNRIRARFRHLSRRFRRQGIESFRLYDWDIPEVRAVVDWYAGHVIVGEYVRLQTGPEWLPQMAAAVAITLHIPPERVHVKQRRTNTREGEWPRYRRNRELCETADFRQKRFKVRERHLYFWVNLDDFLDTGLYPDHRDTRVIVGKMAAGRDFLNLYAYTGAFTCAAATGGARTTVSVDRSATYLSWARDNLELNGIKGPQHALIQSDVSKYLAQAYRERRRFTLAFIDPPSFFKDRGQVVSFDINHDHPSLIRDVIKVMSPGSPVFFSTNHQRFEPCLDGLPVRDLTELTPRTIPEDYRNKRIHRCWRMIAA
jgi:23S rRNA G2069 N7-methylase RlmK/C1962 C5-methylase RlmI